MIVVMVDKNFMELFGWKMALGVLVANMMDLNGGNIMFYLIFLRSVCKIATNGGDWRSKSLALPLMLSTTLDGFYFANCVLAAVFLLRWICMFTFLGILFHLVLAFLYWWC